MGRTACTEPQCLYKGALYLYLTVELYLYSPYGPYGLYRASVPVHGCNLPFFVLWPTNTQLFHKLSHSYMFRHYRVILRELLINTLPSYTSISNAAVGNPPPDGATARGGPWPPLQCASRPLDSLLCLSIHLNPSSSGPWTRHPATSFLVFLFVLLHTAFRTTYFFGIAVSCILSMWPSHRILWHLMNLTMFSPLIMASNSAVGNTIYN